MQEDQRELSWRERHAASIMGAVLFGLLALVIINQVAC
jgi:hypothetical protein